MPEDSSVERLKRKLYKRNEEPKLRERRELHEIEYDVHGDWSDEEQSVGEGLPTEGQQAPQEEQDPKAVLDALSHGELPGEASHENDITPEQMEALKHKRVMSRIIRIIFVASVLFFIFAAGLAGYFLIGGQNQVSCENIGISVSGPKSIASGKELNLSVEVENYNNIPIRSTVLELEYPEGARSAQDATHVLPTSREQIGTIDPGEKVRSTAQVILFGQEQTEQTIKARVTHGIDDSNATFTCEVPYPILISTAPVSLVVTGLEEISSGQELELTVSIASNAEEVVPGLRLVASYPYGFEFVSASPKPITEDNVWEVGDLAPGVERTLVLRGIVSGQGVEARTIRFELGSKDDVNNDEVDVVMQRVEHGLLISKPFLNLEVELDKKNESEVVAELGQVMNGLITWTNTVPYAIHDVEIDARFVGAMLNEPSVKGEDAYYRSIDQTLTWTPQTKEEFRVIEANATGLIPFNFSTNIPSTDSSVVDPTMQIEFEVRARRVSDEAEVQQTLTAQAQRTILYNTNIELDTYALYTIGPFTNTGPYPPKVDQRTTFTIIANVTNTTNNMDNVQLTAEVPIYVKWLNTISPSSEAVSYDPVTRRVTWNLGEVPHGTGFQTEARELAFQVELLPSISQEGKSPKLISDFVLEGVDQYTGDVLQREVRFVDTDLDRDPYLTDVSGGVKE